MFQVINVANDFIEDHFLTNLTDKDVIGQGDEDTMIIARDLSPSLLDPSPLYLLQFETNGNCSMSDVGDNAKTYR